MMRNRVERVVLATAVAIAVAGCVAAGQTGTPGRSPAGSVANAVATPSALGATRSPAATPTRSPAATPTLSPGDTASAARAVEIVRALGGSIPPDGAIERSPDPSGQPGKYFTIGDWSVRWGASGRLVAVSVVPSHPDPAQGVAIPKSDAQLKAEGYMGALGLSLGAPDLFYADPELAWLAQWYRRIDGVPVPSDGARMTLAPNGAFRSYSYLESATAPAPASTISQAAALAKAPWCRSSSGGPKGLKETCTAQLEWHAPQTTPGPPLRLCWRIEYRRADNDGSSSRALWLDAGTGETVDGAATM